MTNRDLAQYLSKRTGLAASICEAFLSEMAGGVVEALARGEDVNLEGLGTLRLDKFPDAGGSRLRLVASPEVNQYLKTGYARVSNTEVFLPGQTAKARAAPPPPPPAEPESEPLDPSEAAEELEALFSTEEDHSANPHLDPGERRAREAPALSGAESASKEGDTALSSFAADVLELGAEELARGLGLAAESNPVAQRRLTFPVQISPQAKEASQRRWRPVDGDERRSFKELTLKNFFLSLGSVVRERATREPLIVFDVAEKNSSDGEQYAIRLLRVAGTQPPLSQDEAARRSHNFKFMEIDFDWNRHEPLMVIDEKVGPRVHSFEIGTFRDNDRRARAEVILATEYESYMGRRSGLFKSTGGK